MARTVLDPRSALDDPARLEDAFRPGSVPRIEVEKTRRGTKVLLSRTDSTDMYRRAFARHRTGAALLLGLSLRAPSASAEPAEPDETRVGAVEGKAAEELPSAAETPPILAAPNVAPRLIQDEGVAYPEQALGERFYERVEVRLVPELDASGHVRSSSVETPQGDGFDEEATRAARQLLFEPALRAGALVPARIRYRYIFEVPDPTRVGRVTDAVTGLPVAGANLQVELDRADAQRASTLEDGSFALPALRGGTVTVRVESSRHLAQQTNVQLVPGDEARSVIHQGLIDRVDLYPGGYPARFGRFASGVVSAQMRGSEPALSAEANLRLFDVGGLIETPFAPGRSSLYSYSAALLSLFSPEVKLDYRDYQARATYEPSARDRFSVLGFGSYDPLGGKRNGILRRLGDACRPRITFTW
jgi:TonB family protein